MGFLGVCVVLLRREPTPWAASFLGSLECSAGPRAQNHGRCVMTASKSLEALEVHSAFPHLGQDKGAHSSVTDTEPFQKSFWSQAYGATILLGRNCH